MQEFEHEGLRLRMISDFPGYFIGEDGSVWSKRGRGSNAKKGPIFPLRRLSVRWYYSRKKSENSCQNRYIGVEFAVNGCRCVRRVHRLVLEAFVGFCPKGMLGRHLNGDPSDNWLENLSWGTYRENQMDRLVHGTRFTKLTEDKVRAIRKEWGSSGSRSLRQIGFAYGVEKIIYFRMLEFLARGAGRGGESECPSCGCPTKFGHEGDCDILVELERLSCRNCDGHGCSVCRDRGIKL